MAQDEGALNVDTLRRRVEGIEWYHSIDLGHGIVTRGVDDSSRRLSKYHLPADLSGKSVLDIGAWDGFYSFECERRGASTVLAMDSYAWNGSGWGTKAGFELAREVLGSHVEDVTMEVSDLSPDIGTFDVVLCLGVLYHLRHPLLALEHIASVTDDLLILSTQLDLLSRHRPAMAFYERSELNRDSSNWWAPNLPALLGMLRDVGFSRIDVVTPPYRLPVRVVRAAKWALRKQNPFLRGIDQSRVVVHARRR